MNSINMGIKLFTQVVAQNIQSSNVLEVRERGSSKAK
jgi:hypothetical protein